MGGGQGQANGDWTNHPTPNRIIDATERLLQDNDIRSLAVADILRESGVARGTFYLWFHSKFDLIGKAYLRASFAISEAAGRWVEPSVEPEDRLQRIEDLFDEAVESWRRHGPVLRAVQDTWRLEPAIAAHWVPARRWARNTVATQIAISNGREAPSTTDRLVAGALVNLSEQTLYQASTQDEFSLDSGVQRVIASIWFDTIYRRPQPIDD